jgi:predicted component of type VI protein secretion system
MLLPSTRRARRRHRAVDAVEDLRGERAALERRLADADALIADLYRRIASVTAGWDAANARANQAAEADARVAALEAEVRELRAELADARAITVPSWVRDIDPDDQPTHPAGIDVRPLWSALGGGA